MTPPHQILLVEDSIADAHLARRALSESSFSSALIHARDGEEAMAVLRREGDFSDSPRPELILLDLNLPRKNGREVLKELRSDDTLTAIPVVVLSTSASEADIDDTYRLGANSYIVKPVELSEFYAIMESLQAYWFRDCALPSRV